MKVLKNELLTIKLNGVELDIKGTYYPASGGFDYWTPPEPACFEIDEVKICSFDATELLDFKMDDIEELILAKYE